jgi:hypothetical protein
LVDAQLLILDKPGAHHPARWLDKIHTDQISDQH